ncbi:MAG: FMN-binding protein, partial [Cetobacterium sp.]
MKKMLILIGSICIATMSFAKLNDGTFRVEDKNFDKRGWKVFVELVVKNSKIESSNFDYLNADGKLKSKDIEYNKKYREISKIDIPEFQQIFSKGLVETQNPDEIDDVAGASQSLIQFKTLVKAAMRAS